MAKIDSLPSIWGTNKLKYLATSFCSSLSENMLQDEGEYPVYGASGIVGYLPYYQLNEKFIGIIKDGAGVGRVNAYKEKTSLLGTMAYIIPNQDVDIDWLLYVIKALDLGNSIDKTTIPHIYFSEYGNYIVPYPSMIEQKQISNFLNNKCNQINEIIDKLKQESKLLQEYKKSITKEMVTKGLNNKNFIESGVAWLGDIPNHWTLMRGKYCMTCDKIIVGNKVDEYDRLALTLNGVVKRSKDANDGLQPSDFATYQIVKPNQLVFKLIDLQNISTSRVGRSDYLGIVSPAYIVLECGEKLNPRYAEKYYLSMWQREIFNTLGDDGVRSNLNAKDLLDLPILVPPLEEQKRIADYLDDQYKKINDISDGIKEEIRILEDYKKSLIYEYVTGKKVVKDE